jgi:hypothetical protein
LREPIPEGRGRRGGLVPTGLSDIRLDGEESHFFEWRNAARYDAAGAGGAMTRSDRLVEHVWLAFSAETMYLRVDFDEASRGLPELSRLVLEFRDPLRRRFRYELHGAEAAAVAERFDGSAWRPVESASRLVKRDILELALPWREIPARANQELTFTLTFLGEAGILAVVPAGHSLVFSMPEADYDRIMWKV